MMDEEITIGLLTSLTGIHTEAYGLPMQRGFELAREEINMHSGTNFTFITVDDKSTHRRGESGRTTIGGSRRTCYGWV